ncbi:uncharacterized protein LOC128984227 [Macrosteles quadrilineatus]|uniref:uncharacterized protein LOC128984227 n=1 Tax=Macrosteles quadrilineatus TaxID=74068 RepID=UPI0023E166CB|nr:uncharacterized protein LOC128984227 [Macrosteles quadrilineatus]
MPKRKSNLSQKSKNARRVAEYRRNETIEEREARLLTSSITTASRRAAETPAQREARQTANAYRTAALRADETPAQREARQAANACRMTASRADETPAQREVRLSTDNERHVNRRANQTPVEHENDLRHRREERARFLRMNWDPFRAMEQWPEEDLKVVIRADRRPPGEHERRFNAPTTNEVAAVVVNDEIESRDIVLRKRDETLLLNQFVVDMFVKIESERLLFLKRNQSKLRSDNYVHLQDAVANDGNVDPNNVGQLVILPSSFTGSPRRRGPEDGGNSAETTIAANRNNPINIDNSWIVPFNPVLSKMFNAHINVEYCSSVKSIKYVCKYIHKGSDQAVFNLRNKDVQANVERNEIEIYQTGRYVSTNEAFWRIFSFPVHERYPTVTHLSVHLENGQRIYFNEDNMQEKLLNPPNTTLTAFFKLCETDPFAQGLLYPDVPHYYTWNASTKEFKRRLLGQPVEEYPDVKYSAAIGRVYTVHPNNVECFCLRILLHKIRGPKSFIDLRTVGNTVFDTYKETCQALGLLEDDQIWKNTLEEALQSRSSSHVRYLFSIMISSCGMYNPTELWETFRMQMSEDIVHRFQLEEANDIVYNEALRDIEKKVFEMCGKKLSFFGLPNPQTNVEANSEIFRELSYNTNDLQEYVRENLPKLTNHQRKIYDTIINKIENAEDAVFFLDAPGGTGKTFLINILLAAIRQENKIVIAVASSGIAATLLPGGRTAHSVFKLPLNLTNVEMPTCNIPKDSERAALLRQCSLIVWYECTMAHKGALEALDRSLRDIRGSNTLMGGLVVLMAGDFRQTLPVIQRGTPADEISACLKSSRLWDHVSKLYLTENMRVILNNDGNAGEFALSLLKIGEGKIPTNEQQIIELPRNFCKLVDSTEDLISSVFPDFETNYLSSGVSSV